MGYASITCEGGGGGRVPLSLYIELFIQSATFFYTLPKNTVGLNPLYS